MDNDASGPPAVDRRELKAPSPGRIDTVLAAACADLSRARVQRLIAAGQVLLNGQHVRKSVTVAEGDVLTINISEPVHTEQPPCPPLAILFEDDLIVAIDKPAGIAVHGGPGERSPTIAAWFLQRYPAAASAFGSERPGIVHRLDKDTTGVLVLARTPEAQAVLSAGFAARTTRKDYLAVCEGIPDRPHAVIDAAIGRRTGDRTRMAIARRGRESRTEYTLVASGTGRSLLLVRPETGRTHQIRVHLAAIGVPVAHDRVYGKGGEGRQLLHAWRLVVHYPRGGRLTITAPMPPDMVSAVRAMGVETLALPYASAIPPEFTEEPV